MKNRLLYGIVCLLVLFLLPLGLHRAAMALSSDAQVTVSFSDDKAGFGASRITVTPGSKTQTQGYFLVYYTSDTAVLPDYDAICAIKASGNETVSGTVSDGCVIPAEATGIAVFECDAHFTLETLRIEDAIATASIPVEKRLPVLGTPTFSFGALSDTHMNYEQHNRGAYKKLENAMNFFADKEMDLVLIAGDVTGDRGENPDLEAQYEKHREILAASRFPAEKVYEAIGNHGNTPADAPLLAQYLGGSDEVHPFPSSPYYHVLKENNLFIFMAQELQAPGDSAKYDNFSQAQIDWLEELLNQYGSTDTNVFIIEHAPFLNYGAGDIENGSYTACITPKAEYPQTMRFFTLLQEYRDAVVFSGHTHVSFYENANYSNENGTFARTVHIGSTSQPCGYGTGTKLVRSFDGRKNVTPEYGSEGYTVEIYSDTMIFTGYNFSTGKKIPTACLILPLKTKTDPSQTQDFTGAGTLDDPYQINTPADFKRLTDAFNASVSSEESQMYGYGKYFLQTADLDMTDVEGYLGSVANGNAKCYFAGIYNGGGHTLRVDVDGTTQRSVFPYVYGTVCNLKITGKIRSETSAQPIRTLYGSVVNCIFQLELDAKYANGILYSNYNRVYNVYTTGTLTGSYPHPVSANNSSTNYQNVFHWYTANQEPATDSHGTRTNDLETVKDAFHKHEGDPYTEALSAMGGFPMLAVAEKNGELVFLTTSPLRGDVDGSGVVDSDDAIYLLFHTLFEEDYPLEQNGDFDGNTTVDSDDAIYLLFHTLFEEDYPI